MKREIIFQMLRVVHEHKRRSNELLEQNGVSMGQPPILRYLSQNDGCIQRDLAMNCHVKPATITSALDNMEQSGYIQRRSLPGDRRAQRVFLTDEGRKKHELVHEVFRQLEEDFLRGIPESEADAFRETLAKILNNIQKPDKQAQTEGE